MNNAIIPGATTQTLVVTQTGTYFSIVTQNNCPSDTSNKIQILIHTGIANYSSDDFSVSPNPSTGIFTIQSNEKFSTIEIMNVLGETVYSVSNNPALTSYTIDLRNHPKGVYFYRLAPSPTGEGRDEVATGKIIIE
jgi:hypothetical protein